MKYLCTIFPSLIVLVSLTPQVCAKMGVAASFMLGKGSPTTQVVNLITGSLYTSFVEKDTSSFPEFHEAFLDIFNAFNSALPGKHYDVPSRLEVEKVFATWKNTIDNEERKQVFEEFIKEKVGVNKPERLTLITGLVTPPASMAAKKAGERVPALSIIKAVPDVVFVPTATFLALISVKLSKNVLQKRVVQQDQKKTLDRHKTLVRQKTLLAEQEASEPQLPQKEPQEDFKIERSSNSIELFKPEPARRKWVL